jgi:glycosyltransferase involved in cell wall biosynthesis
MRLIHVAGYHSQFAGSFVPLLRAALREGLERGLRAEAVFPEVLRDRRWARELESDGIPCRFIPFGGLDDVLDGGGPAILHVHFSQFQLEAARAARRNRDVTLFWHVHTKLERGPYMWLRNTLRFGPMSRGVERIFCVAPDLARGVRRRLGPASKVEFFPNAIDLDAFRPTTADERRAARDRLGLPQDARVLAHMGRDWHLKGGDLYEAAVRRLAERGLRDIVAGSVCGEDYDGPIRRLVPGDRIQDVYAAADLFVSPSRAEGMPLAVMESLACGTGVVASDIPGQRYVGEDLDAVRLVPLDADALAGGIESMLGRDPADARAAARQALVWLERNMDLRAWARRLFEYYEEAGALPPAQRSSAVPS